MLGIKEVLLNLKELNINNDRLRKIEKNITDIKNNITNLENNVNNEKAVLEKFEKEHSDLIKKIKESELEIKSYESKIKDLNSKKFLVKTQAEMEAMVKEIYSFKDLINQLEDVFYLDDEKVNKISAKIKEQKQKFQSAEKNFNTKKTNFLKNIENYEKEFQELTEKNLKINKILFDTETSNSEVLKIKRTLENLIKKRAGLVVANVNKTGNCEICGFNIPPQLINEVRALEKLYQCPGCSRILCVNDGEE